MRLCLIKVFCIDFFLIFSCPKVFFVEDSRDFPGDLLTNEGNLIVVLGALLTGLSSCLIPSSCCSSFFSLSIFRFSSSSSVFKYADKIRIVSSELFNTRNHYHHLLTCEELIASMMVVGAIARA